MGKYTESELDRARKYYKRELRDGDIIDPKYWKTNLTYDEYRIAKKYHPDQKERNILTPTLRKRIYERDGNRCLNCGSIEDLSIDHIIPLSKGGKTVIQNLQTLCMKCNLQKYNK
ncbi:MAG: HNH endonuclease [Tannerellaceae bacterium]|jgi:5-methylcytosine-specific restriction endonuclease McrA|nr:HNH endonuclease [Tannerellaceae bacterium]